jgi:transcriptional regulator with XRE-family HTH domain
MVLATQHGVVSLWSMSDAETAATGADVGPLGQAFAREVRRRRERRGLSQTDLALQLRNRYGLKFHQATIDRVEKAARPCRLDEVYAIAEVLGSTVDDMLDDWSTTDRAWRQLAGTALRAREAEARIALAVQQNLESIQGDRERVLTGLKRRGEPDGTDEVDDWARDVLADLDRIWAWAADFAKTSANTPPVPAWVSDVLNDAHPTTAADEREA